MRAAALHGSDQSYNRYSGGGGNSGKQQLAHMQHQGKQHQQMAGPSHFEAQNQALDRGGQVKIKQGPTFGMGADPKAQANMRTSFNNATDRAASMVQASMGGAAGQSSGQPALANTGPNAQGKNV